MKSRTRPNLVECLEICRNRAALGSGGLKFRRNDSEVINVGAGIFTDESLNAVCYLVCGCDGVSGRRKVDSTKQVMKWWRNTACLEIHRVVLKSRLEADACDPTTSDSCYDVMSIGLPNCRRTPSRC